MSHAKESCLMPKSHVSCQRVMYHAKGSCIMPKGHVQSCLRTGFPSKRDSEMLKTRFKKRVAFEDILNRVYLKKRVINTRFVIFNKVSFAVSSNLVCIVILFKIVTLIFPHRLCVCNAIYVEYRVVYRVVVSYILRVL